MVNLCGGSEYGEEWYRVGMRENKQNVFDDFIVVFEKFKKEGYCIVVWGRSNGGLFVLVIFIQRLDVMDVVLIGYFVIDMFCFYKFYIGSVWILEYGNLDDLKDREFLLKYFFYYNVDLNKCYLLMFIYIGLYDDRVYFVYVFKFFMKLREVGVLVYFRVEMKSGYMGVLLEMRVREFMDLLVFVVKMFR